MKQFILRIAAFNANLQLAHWRADTKTNEHHTLGELYGEMVTLLDTFAEAEAGQCGSIDFPEMNVRFVRLTPANLLETALTELANAGKTLSKNEEKNASLLNILADMQGAVYKAKYLLKV